jgi:membrane protein DedA with SNARE-associated domain
LNFYGLERLAALISVPVWVLLGWWFGQNIDAALAFAASLQKWVLLGVVVVIFGYVGGKMLLKKRREKLSGQSITN